MERTELGARLERMEWFRELAPEARAALLDGAQERDYAPGEVLFREGAPREMLFLLLHGQVLVTRAASFGERQTLMAYGGGEFLAEGALFEEAQHSTTATATLTSRALCFSQAALRARYLERPELEPILLKGMLRAIARRLSRLIPGSSPEALQLGSGRTRAERDLLGEFAVPAEAYYGVQTARAIENFAISGQRLQQYPELIEGLAIVKQAAARANHACGRIDARRAGAIEAACLELRAGKLHSQFAVDLMQGGAGTSTNMNANEVIANRALEILGHEKGQYEHLDPHNHVNCSQSTNDAYPTALKIALCLSHRKLVPVLRELIAALRAKGVEFRGVLKMGRTQLQDAVPMTLGQEFEAYAASLEQEIESLEMCAEPLLSVNMGGTAIGTGINAPPDYAGKVATELARITTWRIRLAPNLIEATQDTRGYVLYSSALKCLAIKLSKICNDLRLLSSGPRAGLGEIVLPAMQPGSSIMPGKVNPVIPEVVNQVCFRVLGNDLVITLAAEAGQLELNVMEPVIAASLLESLMMFRNAASTLRHNCIEGIRADEARCRAYVENSIGVVTALNPVLGYETSTRLAAEALHSGRGIVELVREQRLLSEEQIATLLDPRNMLGPRRGD